MDPVTFLAFVLAFTVAMNPITVSAIVLGVAVLMIAFSVGAMCCYCSNRKTRNSYTNFA